MEYLNWPGISGKTYTMGIYTFGIPFHEYPGVYIFCKPSTVRLGKWAAIYVGECENFDETLNKNLLAHHRWDCIRQEGATHVCALRIEGARSLRLEAESDLRRRINAPCN